MYLRFDASYSLGRVILRLRVLRGPRTDGEITQGSQGVKIAFDPDNRACTSCSIGDTCSALQSEPEPAAAQTARVVFVMRSLHQLQHIRHV